MAVKNLWSFGKIMALIFLSIALFGEENTLPAVCICVAWLMYPECPLNIKKKDFLWEMLILFPAGALCPEIGRGSLWGFLVYACATCLILFLSLEPEIMQYSMPYLLNFVFCQAVPVTPGALYKRLLCLLLGSVFVFGVSVRAWKKKGFPAEALDAGRQIHKAAEKRAYIIKMAAGLGCAMALTDQIHFAKPLWVSIVVMSLTEAEENVMHEKIRDRIIGTVIGLSLFWLIVEKFIPMEGRMVFIFLLGYASFFFSGYRTKAIVNAISSVNAAELLLGGEGAVKGRVTGLVIGIGITLVMHFLGKAFIGKSHNCHLLSE